MDLQFWKGKTAAVCGASTGLGRNVAQQLAASGVRRLLLIARNQERLLACRTEIQEQFTSVQVDTLACDLADQAAVATLVGQIADLDGYSRIDLVVAAVGQSDRGCLVDLEAAHLASLVRTNVISALNVLQTFRTHVAAAPGTFVLIGSLASLFAPRFLGGYAIAKHALPALAQQARLELSAEGIHVLLACPGPIQREDAGQRYQSQENKNMPQDALQPGGGAKVKGLEPTRLSRDILNAAAKRKRLLIRPRKAILLRILSAFSSTVGDSLLRNRTS